ncbi:MAG: hypothetical protein VXX63_04425 [Bacteroidota bacterium]|nr:hypothetical protein [Bacteroidota bacterium]
MGILLHAASKHRFLFCLCSCLFISCASKKLAYEKDLIGENDLNRKAFEQAYYRGVKNKIKGDHLEAKKSFQEALGFNPYSHESLYQISLLSDSETESLLSIQKAVLLNSTYNKWYMVQLALAYEKNKNWMKASESYELMSYLEQRQNKTACYFLEKAAECAILDENHKRALKLYKNIVQKYGPNPSTFIGQIKCYELMRLEAKALQVLNELSHRNLDDQNILFVANKFLKYKQFKLAKTHFRKIREDHHAYEAASRGVFNVLLKEENYDSLCMHAENAIKSKNLSIEYKLQMMKDLHPAISNHSSDSNKPIELGKKIVKQHPEKSIAWLAYADAYFAQSQKDSAWKNYHKAIQLGMNDLRLVFRFLELSIEQKRIDAAVDVAQNMQNQYPNQIALYFFEARGWMQKRNFQKALLVLDKSEWLIYDEKTKTQHTLMKANALSNTNQWAQAKMLYLKMLEKMPNNALIMAELLNGQYLHEKNPEQAQKLANEIRKYAKDPKASFVHHSLAMANFLNNKDNKALEEIAWALESSKKWEYYLLQSRILRKKNLMKQSKIAIQNALNLAPTAEIKQYIQAQFE